MAVTEGRAGGEVPENRSRVLEEASEQKAQRKAEEENLQDRFPFPLA